MSLKKTGATDDATAVFEKAAAPPKPTYALDNLKKHCLELFGVTTSTFVGATTGIEAREYTVDEIKSIINEWCGKVVK